MNLISFTNAEHLAEQLGVLAHTRPDFASYDHLTSPSQYYLWFYDNKMDVFKGDAVQPHWKKVTLIEIAKLGSCLFSSISTANLPPYLFFFTLLRDHFAGGHTADALLTTLSFFDRAHTHLQKNQRA